MNYNSINVNHSFSYTPPRVLTQPQISNASSSSSIKQFSLRRQTRQWTKEEDDRLREATKLYGTQRWHAIAQYVGNGRNQSQCSQRWQRVLDPKIKKTNWSEEEDRQLLQLVENYGTQRWMRIANEIGDRSDVQCRYRYYQIQKLGRKDGFSSDDMKEDQESEPSPQVENPTKPKISLPSISQLLDDVHWISTELTIKV